MQDLNTNRLFEINSDIVEWDIKSAGISIIREFKMLPPEKINKLLQLPKENMNVSIGKIGQKDHAFSKELEKHFNEVVLTFMKQNNLDQKYDVLSIKRDAVFTINREIINPSIGEYINFIPKNRYHAYLYIKPFEFYFGTDDFIEVKGLCGDKVEREKILSLHKNGILNLLNETIRICETTNMDRKSINEFFSEFVLMYKRRELDFEYYREFSIESMYRYNPGAGSIMMMNNIDQSILNKIDISYNYTKLILPLINMIC